MKVVIVGSGLAGITLGEALAKSGRHQLSLVTSETHGYYSRPRLSHGLALSEGAAAKILMKRFDALPFPVLAGTQVARIDRERREALLADGRALPYDVLALATGSAAVIPPALAASRPHLLTLNSLDDLLTLRHRRANCLARAKRPHWAVIGGGLIGCEVASDLHKAGDAVTIFQREPRLLELLLSEPQSQALHQHFSARGIELLYNQAVRAVQSGVLVTADGEVGPFDGVIVATGFAPRIGLAKEASLETAKGIVVDEYLRTSDPAVYAVGDVAQIGERLYAFVSPIRSQALWLAEHLEGRTDAPWTPPAFTPVIKIHDFKYHSLPQSTGGSDETQIRRGAGARDDSRAAHARGGVRAQG